MHNLPVVKTCNRGQYENKCRPTSVLFLLDVNDHLDDECKVIETAPTVKYVLVFHLAWMDG